MHRGFAFGVDGVGVIAEGDREADGFDDLGLGARIFVGRAGADASGNHQRGRLIGIG